MAGPEPLFSGRRFLPLFLAQAFAAFTDNALRYAITILVVYQLAQADAGGTFVALGTALFILPYFLFSSLAGELADKRDKATLAKWLKLFQLVIMLLGAASLWAASLPFFLVILFLAGTEAAFFSPVKYGLLPQHLARDELVKGNGYIEMTTFVAVLGGTLFGGGLVLSGLGREIIAGTIIVLSLVTWAGARLIPEAPPAQAKQPLQLNPFTGTWAILKESFRRKQLLKVMLGISWFWFTGALMLTLFPPFTKDLLGGDAAVANLFIAAFTVGIAAGSLAAHRLLNGEISARFVPLAGFIMALGLLDLWLASPEKRDAALPLLGLGEFMGKPLAWRVLADLVIISFAGGIFAVPLNALLQAGAKLKNRARLLAANNVLNALFMTVSSAIAAIAFSQGATAAHLFGFLAFANLAAAVLGLFWLPAESLKLAPRAFFRAKVSGLEHARLAGGAVVIANHQSRRDTLLLATYLPHRPIVALAANAPRSRLLARLADIHELDPENPLSIRPLVAALKARRKVILLPEPHASTTGGLMKLEETPAMLAHMAGVPLLPVRIDGLAEGQKRRGAGLRICVRPAERLDAGDAKGPALRAKLGIRISALMTRVIVETAPQDQTLPQALIAAMREHGPHHEILEDIDRKPIHFRRLIMACFILGRALARRTAGETHVGVLLPNANGALITLFGLLFFRRVPAMLNYSTGGLNMTAALTAAEVRTVITSRRFIEAAKLDDDLAMLASRARIVYLDDVRAGLTLADKLIGMAASRLPKLALGLAKAERDPDATAVVLFTSGSEGLPKGVALSHRNINMNRHQAAARIDFTPDDRMFNPLPMFHAFGLTAGTLLPVLGGVRTFLYPSPLHYKAVPELCYASRATILVATDTFLMGYGRNAHPHDFHRMRYVVAGAERVKEETRQLWFERFGIRILEGYGATECAPVLSVNTPLFCKAGSTGRIFDCIDWRLAPVEGIAHGGRLQVKGPNIMKGYLRADNPGVLETSPDGWYDTGDIVEVDEQGFITILGRAKRFSKVAGEMVSLGAVEQAIAAAFPDHGHAVVAVPDAKKGEQLLLITTLAGLDRRRLQEALRGKLAELMIPRHVIHREELPVLGTGKTDYVTLNRIARELVPA